MQALFKAELFKLTRNKAIVIALLICLIPIFSESLHLMDFVYSSLQIEPDTSSAIIGCNAAIDSNFNHYFFYIIPLFINVLFTDEFSKRTYGNIVFFKNDKEKGVIVKLLILTILIFFSHLLLSIFAMVANTMSNGWGETSLIIRISEVAFLSFKKALYYVSTNSVAIICALLISQGAVVTIIYFVWNVLTPFIAIALSITNNAVCINLLPFTSNEYVDMFTYSFEIPNEQAIAAVIIKLGFLVFISLLLIKKKEI